MNRGSVAVQRCGLARRLLVISYDSVIVIGILVLAAALASPLDRGNQHALRDPVFTLYLVGVWYLYLAWCWQHGGMTVGMRAWGVRLHSTDGSRPGWRTSLVRFAVALASGACVGLGFAWSLFDGQRRCWHDIASNTGLFRETRSSD